MAVAIGGSTLQLTGCQPDVRAAVLSAMELGTQGLVSAVFLSLQGADAGDSLTTTG